MIKTPLNLIAPAVRASAFRRRTLSRIKSHRAPLRLHAPVPPHPLILAAALYRALNLIAPLCVTFASPSVPSIVLAAALCRLYRALNLIAIWYNVRIEDDARDRNFANTETSPTPKPHRP